MNTIVLLTSIWAVAQPQPDLTRAGLLGVLAYVVVSLSQAWVEAHRDAIHRDDCAKRLADVQAALAKLLERGGEASPLKPDGRQPEA